MRQNFVARCQRRGMKEKGRIQNDSEISSLGNQVNIFIDKDKEIQLPESLNEYNLLLCYYKVIIFNVYRKYFRVNDLGLVSPGLLADLTHPSSSYSALNNWQPLPMSISKILIKVTAKRETVFSDPSVSDLSQEWADVRGKESEVWQS